MPSFGKTSNLFPARCDCCRRKRKDCATVYRVVNRNLLYGWNNYSPEPESICRECRIAIGTRNYKLDAKHGRRAAAELAAL